MSFTKRKGETGGRQIFRRWTLSGKPVYCLGRTQEGLPKHPLARGTHRVPDDQQPIVWRAA